MKYTLGGFFMILFFVNHFDETLTFAWPKSDKRRKSYSFLNHKIALQLSELL